MNKEQIQHCFYLRSEGLPYAAIAFSIGTTEGRVRYALNKDSRKETQHKSYEKNKQKISEKGAEYRSKNKKEIANRNKKYRQNNSERINEQRREGRSKRQSRRYKNDEGYRMSVLLRNRLRMALKGSTKRGSAVKDLGCSIPELKTHLEKQFTGGMTWDNQGDWHIDHIVPMASFDLTDRDQLLECCNYRNLQPLWALENLRKGASLV